jgi:hypothetical protein
VGRNAARADFLGIEKHLEIKSLSSMFQGGASYRKYKY